MPWPHLLLLPVPTSRFLLLEWLSHTLPGPTPSAQLVGKLFTCKHKNFKHYPFNIKFYNRNEKKRQNRKTNAYDIYLNILWECRALGG